MAKYDYKCNKCNTQEIVEKPMKDASREEFCSNCGCKLQRIFNATPNKWNCSGAYVTDSRGGAK